MNAKKAPLLAVVVIALALALFAACNQDDPGNPSDNDHARWCVDRGGSVQERSQFGGRWSTSTYWCTRGDQITDIWFD